MCGKDKPFSCTILVSSMSLISEKIQNGAQRSDSCRQAEKVTLLRKRVVKDKKSLYEASLGHSAGMGI